MLGKRMGLFGSVRPGNSVMPGDQPDYGWGDMGGLFRVPTDGGPSMPAEQPKSGGFFGQGGIGRGIAGTVGDWLQQVNGIEPTYGPSMLLQRQQQLAAQRAEQQRKYDLEDYVSKLKLKQQYDPSPGPQPYRTEDNVGNVWEIGPDGNAKPIFIDKTPKYYIQGDQALQIPNPYATQGASQNRPKIGETVRLDQLDSPSISNTPAPQTGANGFPATLTRDQYQAVVNEMGQAETDAWMARNNVRLGN